MSDVTDQLMLHYSAVADKFAPQVIDATKQAATMEAYSCLASSLLWFILAIAALAVSRFFYKKTKSYGDWWIGTIIFGVIGTILLLPGLWYWIDPWTWAAINHPELWIAKRAFNL